MTVTIDKLWTMMLEGTWQTVYMTLVSTAFAYLIGLPLGVLLVTMRRGGIMRPRSPGFTLGFFFDVLYGLMEFIINILRSVPFLILMIAVIPLTRRIMGTAIGSTATIVPLVTAAFPFVARTVESSLLEVDAGVIEAAQAMGSTRMQIVRKVILPEAFPSLINGAALVTTNVLGYSAMAGAIGGGGLGSIAISYGYHRYQTDVLFIAIIVLVVLVQVIQFIGNRGARLVDHRIK